MAQLVTTRGERVEVAEMDERGAHDEAARLWFEDSGILGVVVVSDHGIEIARYERPGVLLPSNWPPKNAKYVSRDPMAPLEAPRAGDGPQVVKTAPAPPPPACGACRTPYENTEARAGDDDPTPSGRLDRYRCPECGAAQPGKTRLQIERAYLAARQEGLRIVEGGPRPQPAPMPPRDPGFWRSG